MPGLLTAHAMCSTLQGGKGSLDADCQKRATGLASAQQVDVDKLLILYDLTSPPPEQCHACSTLQGGKGSLDTDRQKSAAGPASAQQVDVDKLLILYDLTSPPPEQVPCMQHAAGRQGQPGRRSPEKGSCCGQGAAGQRGGLSHTLNPQSLTRAPRLSRASFVCSTLPGGKGSLDADRQKRAVAIAKAQQVNVEDCQLPERASLAHGEGCWLNNDSCPHVQHAARRQGQPGRRSSETRSCPSQGAAGQCGGFPATWCCKTAAAAKAAARRPAYQPWWR